MSIPATESSVASPDPQLADPLSRSPELAVAIPQIQLRFAGVEQSDNLWPVDRTLTLIGRGTHCKLRLDHPDIPMMMACLVRTPGSCWLINLDRRDDVRVNDSVARLQPLDIGDRLQLGQFQAEVSAAPFDQISQAPATTPVLAAGSPGDSRLRELVSSHRQRLGSLNQSLSVLQKHLNDDHLSSVPELKTALETYVETVRQHHQEMQAALEQLSDG